jgi:hypothetical protein
VPIKNAKDSPPVKTLAGEQQLRGSARQSVISPAIPIKSASHSFDAPAEADWHRMISVAAYYRAQKRGFSGAEALEDWLAAEAEVKLALQSS